jgi:phosphopantothenoylcysteine decarboxylase/phosphopantothenate--cysteine ligase
MNCIVTAGPAFEPLDEVRRLTNFSTGRLGTELANFLTARGHTVTLLIGEGSTWPGARQARVVTVFSSAKDLHDRLKSLSRKKTDAIFHAAAVSDFAFGKMFARTPAGHLRPLAPSKKIPTRRGSLLVELVPAPKIISHLREWFPQARIIGWKFEAEGGRADALRAARKQIADRATDACVANGPAYGRGFALVTAEGSVHIPDRARLYAALAETMHGRARHSVRAVVRGRSTARTE